MWPFKPKPASPDLRERIETLERLQRSQRIEWEDTLEKLTRIVGRISKRAALERAAALAADGSHEDAPGSTGTPIDDFSQRVLAQRSHRRLG